MGKTVNTSTRSIAEQAERIRDIAQTLMDAYNRGSNVDAYARNKVVSGSLAADAAVLGIMIVAYEESERQSRA